MCYLVSDQRAAHAGPFRVGAAFRVGGDVRPVVGAVEARHVLVGPVRALEVLVELCRIPDLEVIDDAVHHDLLREARVREKPRRDGDAALGVERGVVGVHRHGPEEAAVGFIVEGARAQPFLHALPLVLGIDRDAGLETPDDDERGGSPSGERLAKARRNADATLVVDRVLIASPKSRHGSVLSFRCLRVVTSAGVSHPHDSPQITTAGY